jgi:hypothetical protein
MSYRINFIAVLAESITEEFDEPLEKLDHQDLEDAAEEHLDSLSEQELRRLYREGPITIDDAFEEESEEDAEPNADTP